MRNLKKDAALMNIVRGYTVHLGVARDAGLTRATTASTPNRCPNKHVEDEQQMDAARGAQTTLLATVVRTLRRGSNWKWEVC